MAFHGREHPQASQTGGSLKRGWPDFPKFGFHYKMRRGALSERAVKNEIDRGRPFLHSWKHIASNRHGHMVVVHGYTIREGKLWIHVVDPAAILHANGKYSARRRVIRYEKAWRTYYAIFPTSP